MYSKRLAPLLVPQCVVAGEWTKWDCTRYWMVISTPSIYLFTCCVWDRECTECGWMSGFILRKSELHIFKETRSKGEPFLISFSLILFQRIPNRFEYFLKKVPAVNWSYFVFNGQKVFSLGWEWLWVDDNIGDRVDGAGEAASNLIFRIRLNISPESNNISIIIISSVC